MTDPGRKVNIVVHADHVAQTIDGFGVNINARYWNDGKLIPTLDLLRTDLGATLYRVDIWGKSNWPDPYSTLGPVALEPDRLARLYCGPVFRGGWEMMRYLNANGIEPYLTCSGVVPAWMCAADGVTLSDLERFCDMLVSLLVWARREEGLRFTLFGPLNETDIGPPEGPFVSPEAYTRVLALLDRKLNALGLDDIRFVVAEQARFDATYMRAILAEPAVLRRVGVWGLHCYSEYTPEQFREVRELAGATPLWMTEYGDLEQSGEREWYVAWVMTHRLFDLLEGGFHGALVWDAFDNYHDHDEAWTIYGLLRTGLRAYTPKHRYYAAKQIFHFVLPGFVRVAAVTADQGIRVLAFTDSERRRVTVAAMNAGTETVHLNVELRGFLPELQHERVTYYRTTATERCHTIGTIPVQGGNWPFRGIDASLPPYSIGTFATI
ncbi:MAG: hypothetical protein HXY39_01695 [Chloroflexi bacterium]|nr:hypothetical protein [Chloroflexota bacterium]